MLSVPSRTVLRRSPLVTARTYLVPIEPPDAPDLWEAVDGSRSHLQRWLPWIPYNDTPESSQRYADACAADWDAGRAVRFAIRDPSNGRLLGVVGLDNCVHLHRSCDLGYWLRKEACGQGLMVEAALACVDFALYRMGTHRIRCAAATDNHRSLHVIAQLGFHFEGIARQAEFVDSRWVDHAVFSRLAGDS